MSSPIHGEEGAMPLTVLVVEDDPVLLRVVLTLLSDAGLDVSGASCGEDALERLASRPFDALLTDLQMPVIDGFEVIRRARAARPSMWIVAMSGHHGPEAERGQHKTGADVDIDKPFRCARLLQALRAGTPT